MFAGCARLRLAGCLMLKGLLFAPPLLASSVEKNIPGFAIALTHETVNDKVAYSPNLPGGGFANPTQRQRFQSQGFMLSYNTSGRTRYHFGLTQRQLNSLRDAFTINELSTGVKRRFQSSTRSRYTLDVGVDVSVNEASEIYKNSFTEVAGNLITEVRLKEPRDARLSVHADLKVGITDRMHANFSINGGLSQTSQQEVVGVVRLDNGCQYAFDASMQGGSVSQLGSCGRLVSYEQHYPNSQSLKDNIGFSVADDLSYRDYFIGPQASLRWTKGSWSFGSGYEFRQYFRPTIDRRIREAGNTPVTRSHTAFANASVNVFKDWQVDFLVKYQKAAFLDDIPFLYSAFTHQRFSGNGVLRYGLTLTRFFH